MVYAPSVGYGLKALSSPKEHRAWQTEGLGLSSGRACSLGLELGTGRACTRWARGVIR